MKRLLSWCVATILMLVPLANLGCPLDNTRQKDIQFPVKLQIKNDSPKPIRLEGIFSSKNSKTSFVLNGGTIAPNDSLTLRIPETVLNEIRDGHFSLRGKHGTEEAFEIDGKQIDCKEVHDQNEWKVTFSLPTSGAGSP